MADIVIIGGGPVGLWTALQIKKRQPNCNIQIYERYTKYKRSHVLRLDHWSLLLYGRNSKDLREQQFFHEITGKGLSNLMVEVTNSLYIRTNDLEAALKSYALDTGILICNSTIDSASEIMKIHPECTQFIAADGAHSKMRIELLGDNDLNEYPLQYVVELKYQVKGQAKKYNAFKINQLLKNMAFEYVGKEKEGVTAITVRFFLNKEQYDKVPNASFKEPLSIDSPNLPIQLQNDIQAYIAMRTNDGEQYCKESGKLSKLTLSLYCATKFAIIKGNQAWFLVGDAAMGVPYFRALNSGLILGSRLAQILTNKKWPINNSIKRKVNFYQIHRPMHIATEFSIAKGKNIALNSYDGLRKLMPIENMATLKKINNYYEYNAFTCDSEK